MIDVADELSCELLVMSEVFIISCMASRVGEKLLEVAIVDDMLQNFN